MEKIKISKKILKKLYCPQVDSYKGKNGRLLIVAGSDKYHGAMYLCALMAAKIVDFVYIHASKTNFSLIEKVREKLAEFIYISNKDLPHTIVESDAVLVGPGLLPNRKTGKLVNDLLKNHLDKKILLDAGALRVVDKKLLHKNCIITPHKQEFEALFAEKSSLAAAKRISLECPAVIILKGSTDYVCQNGQVYYNQTGNAGMTKGGTGDVLAGLLAGLLTKSDAIAAAQMAVYINGLAGDRLFKEFGTYYSASELIVQIQKIFGEVK